MQMVIAIHARARLAEPQFQNGWKFRSRKCTTTTANSQLYTFLITMALF